MKIYDHNDVRARDIIAKLAPIVAKLDEHQLEAMAEEGFRTGRTTIPHYMTDEDVAYWLDKLSRAAVECRWCGRDNSEDGNVCTSDDCPKGGA